VTRRSFFGGVQGVLGFAGVEVWETRVGLSPTFSVYGGPNLTPLERIREIATRVAQSYGLLIDEVVMRREGGSDVLRVVLDRPGPAATPEDSVSITDCERVSQELSTILDVEDLLPDSYTLEVSSPGLDRPLRDARDYVRFAGRLAKIVTRQPVERQTAFAGRLRGMEGDDVLFENEGGKLIRLPIALISRARLEVEF
jgi:ribosome maturation factor RimP